MGEFIVKAFKHHRCPECGSQDIIKSNVNGERCNTCGREGLPGVFKQRERPYCSRCGQRWENREPDNPRKRSCLKCGQIGNYKEGSLWPFLLKCPYCGNVVSSVGAIRGRIGRYGEWRCRGCKNPLKEWGDFKRKYIEYIRPKRPKVKKIKEFGYFNYCPEDECDSKSFCIFPNKINGKYVIACEKCDWQGEITSLRARFADDRGAVSKLKEVSGEVFDDIVTQGISYDEKRSEELFRDSQNDYG